jgi:arylsulfatase
MMVRWPGQIPAGQVVNDIIAQEDWLPTLMSAVGKSNLAQSLLNGLTVGGKKYNVHLDGYDFMPLLRGQVDEGPRSEFLYWTDDGQLANLRYDRWKIVFAEQRAESFDVWEEPFVTLRLPKLFDLRADPFERAPHDGIGYDQWRLERAYVLVPAQAYVQKWLTSFQQYPPRQKPSSFNLDQVMSTLTESTTSGR